MAFNAEPYKDDKGQWKSFAWPGGYPLCYGDKVGDTWCPGCLNHDYDPEIDAPITNVWAEEEGIVECDNSGINCYNDKVEHWGYKWVYEKPEDYEEYWKGQSEDGSIIGAMPPDVLIRYKEWKHQVAESDMLSLKLVGVHQKQRAKYVEKEINDYHKAHVRDNTLYLARGYSNLLKWVKNGKIPNGCTVDIIWHFTECQICEGEKYCKGHNKPVDCPYGEVYAAPRSLLLEEYNRLSKEVRKTISYTQAYIDNVRVATL